MEKNFQFKDIGNVKLDFLLENSTNANIRSTFKISSKISEVCYFLYDPHDVDELSSQAHCEVVKLSGIGIT